jgi:nitrite reductase/ring-hydroxylating ferredoxin subunit
MTEAGGGPDARPEVRIAPIPRGLTAIGAGAEAIAAGTAAFVPALAAHEVAPGEMRRVTFGDLDVLLAWGTEGLVAIDDRCPHMAAPLSLGKLEGCLIDCPLHSGQFDLATGRATRMPTTGGLDPDGQYHPVWSPPGKEPKPDPPGVKAEARRFTRVRLIRYYPLRVRDGTLEVAIPRG